MTPTASTRTRLAAVVAAVVLLGGCSASGDPSRPGSTAATGSLPAEPRVATLCPEGLRSVFARYAGTHTRYVGVPSFGTTGLLNCPITAQFARPRTCRRAAVTINTAPQALVDFNRWVDETVQNATIGNRHGYAPQAVGGIGLAADWVPATTTFETANRDRWVTVILRCPPTASPVAELHVARSLATIAMHT